MDRTHVHVDIVRDDLETLVLDADVLDAVLGAPDPDRKSKEIDIEVASRLRRHPDDPRFRALVHPEQTPARISRHSRSAAAKSPSARAASASTASDSGDR